MHYILYVVSALCVIYWGDRFGRIFYYNKIAVVLQND